MKLILVVGLGGFLGAISRYEISLICNKHINTIIPIGTLLVNILGGLLIGFVMQLGEDTNYIPSDVKVFLTTGFMGGLTTFSTFSILPMLPGLILILSTPHSTERRAIL